jgi:hypothetical protein
VAVAFVLYLAAQISTMAYFVPEQEGLISNAGSLSREVLKARADRWTFRNYFRNIAGVLAFMFLLLACFTGRHP